MVVTETLSMHKIIDMMKSIENVIDASKAEINVLKSSDELGWDCNVKTFSSEYCSFYLSVTPHIFDICILDLFSSSDISHEEFSFIEIAHAMIRGNLELREKGGVLFNKKSVIIDLDGSHKFYSSNCNIRFISNGTNIAARRFKSYYLG